MKIGIAGHGVVGAAMARFLAKQPRHQVFIYDKFQPPYNSLERKLQINASDLAFVCVPTPTAADGFSCDVSAVEECVDWITPPVCIRSTVIPGTVDRLAAQTEIYRIQSGVFGRAPRPSLAPGRRVRLHDRRRPSGSVRSGSFGFRWAGITVSSTHVSRSRALQVHGKFFSGD